MAEGSLKDKKVKGMARSCIDNVVYMGVSFSLSVSCFIDYYAK